MPRVFKLLFPFQRHLLKFFAFFDLEKLIKIFTALLLERSILIVSKDLENLTSCALSLEQLIYPLEWYRPFVAMMPEHMDPLYFYSSFAVIYGVHACIYEKLDQSQLSNTVILLIDEKQVLNGDKDQLPEHIANSLRKKLRYFQDNGASGDYPYAASQPGNSSRLNAETLLSTGPLQAFLDAVVMIIDDYHEYLILDPTTNVFKFNEDAYFQIKNVPSPSEGGSNDSGSVATKYKSSEFYHEFRITQAFEEVRLVYLGL